MTAPCWRGGVSNLLLHTRIKKRLCSNNRSASCQLAARKLHAHLSKQGERKHACTLQRQPPTHPNASSSRSERAVISLSGAQRAASAFPSPRCVWEQQREPAMIQQSVSTFQRAGGTLGRSHFLLSNHLSQNETLIRTGTEPSGTFRPGSTFLCQLCHLYSEVCGWPLPPLLS